MLALLPLLSSRAPPLCVCVCMLMCIIAFRRQLSGCCFSSVVGPLPLVVFLFLYGLILMVMLPYIYRPLGTCSIYNNAYHGSDDMLSAIIF